MLQPKELADEIGQLLDSKKGIDIETMEVGDLTILADYFILCTGTSSTHVRALAEEVQFKLKENHSMLPLNIEGYVTSSWILMDYGSVVVHIFTDETRKFYSLERLWSDAPRVEKRI